MEQFFTSENLIALATLTALEIVLGIDNIIFLTILTGKLPPEQQPKARTIGLVLALGMRLLLLLALSWIMRLTQPLFTLPVIDHAVSGRDLILIFGGLFLIGKSSHEMHAKLEGAEEDHSGATKKGAAANFAAILVQILLLDIVFSLDSVITAVGMASQLWVMITAMIISVLVMLVFAKAIGDFVDRHPTVKILALSFLLLIGVMLVAEGLGQHISKGYIYFAMTFALIVELLNMRLRKVHKPVHLHAGSEQEIASQITK